MFTVAIVGIGLIGGSLGAAIRNAHPEWRVIGINRSPAPLEYALEHGMISEKASLEEGVAQADLIFIATPVSSIIPLVEKIAEHCRGGAVITDVGSTKAEVVRQAEDILKDKANFVGGHPMAGSEKTGPEAARADLFRNAFYLLTPTENTDAQALRTVHSTISSLGALVLALDPEEHDRTIAVISHVPHFASVCLVEVADRYIRKSQDLIQIAAGGFRDMTRIAAGDPQMWLDIALANKDAVSQGLHELSGRLTGWAQMIEQGDSELMLDLLRQAQTARLSLPHVKQEDLEDLYELSIDVPDRPGVLSDVTVTIGSLGINIENIEIVHSPEKMTGTMILIILGRSAAEKAAAALQEKSYTLTFGKVYD